MGKFHEDLSGERRDIEIVKDWLERNHLVESIEEATESEQKQQHFDFHGYLHGERTTFEAKIRHQRYSDLLIETLSNVEYKTLGWIYTSQARHLIYTFIDNGQLMKLYFIDLPALRTWWIKEGTVRGYKKHYGETGTLYRTENYAIPLRDLPKGIIEAVY